MTNEPWWTDDGGVGPEDRAANVSWPSQSQPSVPSEPPLFAPQHYPPPQPGPPLYAAAPPTQMPQAQMPLAQDESMTKRRRSSRPWGKIAVASLTTVAVLAGAWVAYGYFTAGGASSPEEAVSTILDGVTSQDPLRIASVLSPSELPLLAEMLAEVGAARERIDGGKVGTPVPGMEIEVSKVRLKTKELSPRVNRVTISSGRIQGTVKSKSLPSVARSALIGLDKDTLKWKLDVNDIEDDLDNGISAIVVEQGGGWYVSPTLTAADLFVSWDRQHLDNGDFDAFGEVDEFDTGAEDPDGAVEALADAISSGELSNLVAALPSDQAQVAVVFGDALQALLERDVESDAGAGRLPDGWAKLKSFDSHQEDGPADMVRVVIDSAKVTASEPDDSGDQHDFKLDGLKLCETGRRTCDVDVSASRAPLAGKIDKALGGSVSLMVREVDGGWKVDPVASVLDIATRLVKQVDKGVAESVTMSLDGPATDLTMAAPTDVRFGDSGLARVAFPTRPGTVYCLQIDGDDLDEAEVAYNTKDGGNRTLPDDSEGGRRFTFVADVDRTTMAIGGVLNGARNAKVTVFEVPIEDHQLNEEVRAPLAAPMAIHRISLADVSTNEDDLRDLTISGIASGGDIEISVLGQDDLIPGHGVYAYGDLYLDDGEPNDTEVTAYDDTVLVLVQGSVGASFAYRVGPVTRGFDGGRNDTTIVVGPGSTVPVGFDLGSDYGDVHLSVSWNDPVDVDSRLEIEGDIQDEENGFVFGPAVTDLFGSGSGTGQVIIRNLGTQSTTVNLSIDF